MVIPRKIPTTSATLPTAITEHVPACVAPNVDVIPACVAACVACAPAMDASWTARPVSSF
ncbi:hypothetical protein ACFYZT_32160 [Streptomyces sp. NPDC001591]|uniref:hypothetical protein n=1 Tax=Streptomyces sp. NPDC001591 TaxID=3364589 RepID=UPI0036C906A5